MCNDIKGIGFGGDLGSFRLWIDKDFEVGSTRSVDVTYRKGYSTAAHAPANADSFLHTLTHLHACFVNSPLMDGFDFEIEDLVVWGLGGEDAEQRQEKEKLRERTAPIYSARVVVCVRW